MTINVWVDNTNKLHYAVDYYKAIAKNEITKFAGKWMELGVIVELTFRKTLKI
jgi:ribosomal protein L30E